MYDECENIPLQVVDARSKGRFLGTDAEPHPTIPAGHMVGAKNIPYTEVINPETKILKSKHELQEGQLHRETCGARNIEEGGRESRRRRERGWEGEGERRERERLR